MKIKHNIVSLVISFGLSFSSIQKTVKAQIIPDTTLSNNSKVINSINNNLNIHGGTVRGNNLFHSFREFNVNTGQSVFFDASGINNIFTRVTGANPSNIFGTLGVNGNANLFFINPNGIIFGPDAHLDLSGSFFATTADNIRFGNDIYSAVQKNPPPVSLTHNFPDGLGFGSNPGNIVIQGNGHGLKSDALIPSFSLFQENQPIKGLTVNSSNLTLIGGNILFEGGILRSKTGNIEIASIKSGQLTFSPQLNINYNKVLKFNKIQFLDKSLIKSESGSIIIQTENLSIQKGSLLWLSNKNNTALSGNIFINAQNLLELKNNLDFPAGIVTDAINQNGGKITLTSSNLVVKDGSSITTRTFNHNKAGDIEIFAFDSINLSGALPTNDFASSQVISVVSDDTRGASGESGNINLRTTDLIIQNGAAIGTNTLSKGNAGDVLIRTKNLEITGRNDQLPFITSLIGSGGARSTASGNAGNIEIKTNKLNLSNGGLVVASQAGTGTTGKINITATESVKLEDNPFSGLIRASIRSAAVRQEIPGLLNVTNLSPTSSTNNITINTPNLTVIGSEITNKSEGRGKAESINLNIDNLKLDIRGEISATSETGLGGSISISGYKPNTPVSIINLNNSSKIITNNNTTSDTTRA
ncbi:MAG: filamentous hemagglutinin N-terminal domain-containing protein [Prochloraceae cyanobacterium]